MYIISKPHSIWGRNAAAVSLENQPTVQTVGIEKGRNPTYFIPLRRLEIHLFLQMVTHCTYQRDAYTSSYPFGSGGRVLHQVSDEDFRVA